MSVETHNIGVWSFAFFPNGDRRMINLELVVDKKAVMNALPVLLEVPHGAHAVLFEEALTEIRMMLGSGVPLTLSYLIGLGIISLKRNEQFALASHLQKATYQFIMQWNQSYAQASIDLAEAKKRG